MTSIEAVHSAPVRSRTIALGRPESTLEDDPIPAAVDGDVVLFESAAHAYTTIKRTRPDLVVICLTGDYFDGYHVLSMLALDPATSRIPVLTYAIEGRISSRGHHERFTHTRSTDWASKRAGACWDVFRRPRCTARLIGLDDLVGRDKSRDGSSRPA